MSDPSPKPPLDYESPVKQVAGGFLFVLTIFLWAFITSIGITIGVAGGASVSNGNFAVCLAGAVLGLAAMVGLGYLSSRRHRDPRRRSSSLAATLIGVGLGALLAGLCFNGLRGI